MYKYDPIAERVSSKKRLAIRRNIATAAGGKKVHKEKKIYKEIKS